MTEVQNLTQAVLGLWRERVSWGLMRPCPYLLQAAAAES